MPVIIGKHAGFCYGVRAAVEKALAVCEEVGACWSFGALIHNREVVGMLEKAGLRVAESVYTLAPGSVVVLRSHGTPPEMIRLCEERELRVIDATCPNVSRVHRIVSEYSADGGAVIIAGKADHPEVEATAAWANGPVFIAENPEAARALPLPERALLVAQTTLPYPVWESICEVVQARVPALTVANTICGATAGRQREVSEMAETVDIMIVVGGHHSANSRALYETAKSKCERTFFIESAAEIPLQKVMASDIIGITAGASTPEWSLKEVATFMNDMEQNIPQESTEQPNAATEPVDMGMQGSEEPALEPDVVETSGETADQEVVESPAAAPEAPATDPAESSFMADIEATLVTIRPGQTITGTVVQITDDEVCVNIGYKSDGLIKRSDLVSTEVGVGDEIEVEVVKVNDGEGNVVLSQRNIVNRRNWDALMVQYENGEYVEGVGKEAVKGGLIANVNGIRAFIPASQLSQRYVERIEDFVGKDLKLKIIEVDKAKKRIVASRKAVILEEQASRKQEIWSKLIEGEVIKGIVRRLTDFGAFVDIGGVDGLVHVTDLSWGRVRHPSDIVSPNQEVLVKILSLDPDRERIQLGYKQTQPRPWDVAEEKYPVGSIVEGKVVRITTFGAFVELEPGLDGLVHISQCALTRIGKVEDAVQVGQIVRVKVLGVDPTAKRISLSIRAALEDDAFNYSNEIPGDDMMYDADGSDEYATPVDYSQYGAEAPVEEAPVEEAAPVDQPESGDEA